MTTASEKLAKAIREALNGSAEVRAIIESAVENAEQVKEAMYYMVMTQALMNDEKLRDEVSGEMFARVMARIA